ncbi:TPA: hypothetical protein JD264_11255 [Serratia fonticola]|nr:hypothetical protein [Serratia fonticola]
MITGCVGDKITFSEVAEAEGEENKEYFKVRHFYDFMLENMAIFKRGKSESREFVGSSPLRMNLKVGFLLTLHCSRMRLYITLGMSLINFLV